jgi:hypothetical protein
MSSESPGWPRLAGSAAGSSAPGEFERVFFGDGRAVTRIGDGELGGKARGLLLIRDVLDRNLDRLERSGAEVGIPAMTVITTSFFDAFLDRNGLRETAASDIPDERMAHAFLHGDLPAELAGDLRALTEEVRQPLAVRSSGLLEDALFRPFAGVYTTKMIPNNQADPSARFQVLVEAVKYVWASAFFREAKAYRRTMRKTDDDEKMAVLIQEVVGLRHFDRFYPDVSGVARSYNYYPVGDASREEGVVNLALGLGKTIVDGGVTWAYAPSRPRTPPPFGSPQDLLRNTQRELWAVNLGQAPAYDPVRETEYLVRADLSDAELDGTLRFTASTYLEGSDRIVPGTGPDGPRALDFGPVLQLAEWPLNDIVRELMRICEDALRSPVEIEFAATFDPRAGRPLRVSFLQVRPLVVPETAVTVAKEEAADPATLVATRCALGNGEDLTIRDIVWVDPAEHDPARHPAVARAAEAANRRFLDADRPYLLIGFGRWGSSDPWLGPPVTWGQICAARAIVEASLPSLPGDLSQGSHFFHNISSFGVPYFMVRHDTGDRLDWDWIRGLPAEDLGEGLRHAELSRPLTVRVDGRSGRGIIRRPGSGSE